MTDNVMERCSAACVRYLANHECSRHWCSAWWQDDYMYGHKFESHAHAYKSLDVYAFSIIDMCHKNVIGIYKTLCCNNATTLQSECFWFRVRTHFKVILLYILISVMQFESLKMATICSYWDTSEGILKTEIITVHAIHC